MTDLAVARLDVFALAAALLALGGFLLTPFATKAVRALPRAKFLGWGLSALCWIWVTVELYNHPIDFLAFLSPAMTIVLGIILIPLTWVLLSNLLCARAVGGILMLWPMPVILAVRDQITLWRLIPVTIGYASLTLGMVIVFYPWVLRVVCDHLAEQPRLRQMASILFFILGLLSVVAALSLGKVVGE